MHLRESRLQPGHDARQFGVVDQVVGLRPVRVEVEQAAAAAAGLGRRRALDHRRAAVLVAAGLDCVAVL